MSASRKLVGRRALKLGLSPFVALVPALTDMIYTGGHVRLRFSRGNRSGFQPSKSFGLQCSVEQRRFKIALSNDFVLL